MKSKEYPLNFGNLPEIKVAAKTSDISAEIATMQNGYSPFRSNIMPSFVSAPQTTVEDLPGVPDYQGLSTGMYKANSHFFIQARDNFSNKLLDGPMGEIQVIETYAQGGEFAVRLPYKAGISRVQKEVQTIHGVGHATVTSNSAKSLMSGVTVLVTMVMI